MVLLSDHERQMLLRARNVLCDDLRIEDWEFQTVVGLSRDEVRRWQPSNDPWSDQELAEARSILGNVLMYPHGMLPRFPLFGLNVEDLKNLLSKLGAGSNE